MKTLLVALNARFSHSNPAVRTLRAYACDPSRTPPVPSEHLTIYETHINQPLAGVVRDLAYSRADLYGFSCYLWNIEAVLRICRDLRVLCPDAVLLLGGPEIPRGDAGRAFMDKHGEIDALLVGEGEVSFYRLLSGLQSGASPAKIATGVPGLLWRTGETGIEQLPCDPPLDLDSIPFPYGTGKDGLENRMAYYESSRGCPMGCAYCLSSIDRTLRYRSLDLVREETAWLARSGVRTVKFVDRTFNADPRRAAAIWWHITSLETDCVFHFEVLADRLDPPSMEVLASSPPGRIQLEIGIQSVHRDVLTSVGRNTDPDTTHQMVEKLVAMGNLSIHLDLIAGLPGESFERFGRSVDQTFRLRPTALQIGILKILKGTQMEQIAQTRGYRFSTVPPYRVFATDTLSVEEMYRLEDIGKLVDRYHNSGAFAATLRTALPEGDSPFSFFDRLAAGWRTSGLFDRAVSQEEAAAFLLVFLGGTEETKSALMSDFPRLADPREWARFCRRRYGFGTVGPL